MPGAAKQRLLGRPCLPVVAVWTGLNLWSFRGTLLAVPYLYDAPVHERMVQFATSEISAGKLPFTAWFPYLGLGSAQFMHYQSLGAVLTGLVGTVIGAATAFRWAIFLLVGLWPLCVYSSARLFGMPRPCATFAALISPLVVSYTGIAFERGAYSWIGGAEVWTQLFGMWLLPYAWALSWRAFEDKRFVWLAAGTTGFTFAFHFLCGYLAFFGIMVLTLIASGAWAQRFKRGALLFVGSLASAAWVIVPLLVFEKWSAINEVLAETPYVRGYGAGRELEWLFKGELFDARRSLAVVSVLVLCGVIAALAGQPTKALGRALVAMFVACLLLSFGGTTWGPLIKLVPAHADLYFRRFNMGTQLAGIYLAGSGVFAVWTVWQSLLASLGLRSPARRAAAARGSALVRPSFAAVPYAPRPSKTSGTSKMSMSGILFAAVFAVGLGAWTYPAVAQIYRYDRSDRSTITSERSAAVAQGTQLAPLLRYAESHGGGRTYPGQASNWGGKLLLGYVPLYKYLMDQPLEESTYIVPTTSLMLGPEEQFDAGNSADYGLFGIRYLLLPAGIAAPVPADEVLTSGPYALWQLASGPAGRGSASAYTELVRVTAVVNADRADIGSQSLILLDTVGPGQDWAVAWPGGPKVAAPGNLPAVPDRLGRVQDVKEALANGEISATVRVTATSSLLFSVAYDPGWHAWVDGRQVTPEMLAPALVGVPLQPGAHHVLLRYVGFAWYPELWLFSGLSLVMLAWYGPGRRPRRSGPVGVASEVPLSEVI